MFGFGGSAALPAAHAASRAAELGSANLASPSRRGALLSRPWAEPRSCCACLILCVWLLAKSFLSLRFAAKMQKWTLQEPLVLLPALCEPWPWGRGSSKSWGSGAAGAWWLHAGTCHLPGGSSCQGKGLLCLGESNVSGEQVVKMFSKCQLETLPSCGQE